MQERGFKAWSIQLDVTSAADRHTIYDGLQRTDERLGFLVNNIGATAKTKDYLLQPIGRTAQRRLLQALHQQRSFMNCSAPGRQSARSFSFLPRDSVWRHLFNFDWITSRRQIPYANEGGRKERGVFAKVPGSDG